MEPNREELAAIFWKNVDTFREKKGMSWNSLANSIGISPHNIRHSRKNLNLPRMDLILKISNSLNTPIDKLLEP